MVVVGTDGSAVAANAVRWAVREAARRGGGLRVVRAADPWASGEGGDVAGRDLVLRAAVAMVGGQGVEVTTALLDGPAIPALREAADGGDVLVLGHRGAGRVSEFLLLGTTSLGVAGHTARPVVLVRGHDTGARGAVAVGLAPGRGVEAEELAYGFAAADRAGAELRLVRALPSRGVVEGDPLDDLEELLTPWRERFPGVRAVPVLHFEEPQSALLEESRSADLLVIGPGRRTDLRPYLGSVSGAVLHHADCPVAVVTH
ncbi:universal stress protein [Actinocorallia sp. A-T 12471]|uniref:universal stress protein n=1 Tax=Actinocorallia sp. A-T 12471 TaxID=3089813 RepID=UPI0029CE1FFA|nr:universal stress protein [Actinocorallia sp. A-T 12471]MDX6739188.1 universal stress protein [Actinocorallia sp. A-T 12471]